MDSLVDVEDHFSKQALAAPWGELGRSWTLGLVSLVSKAVVTLLNHFSVEGLDTFLQHTTAREPGVGLITVCNHTRCARATAQLPSASKPRCPALRTGRIATMHQAVRKCACLHLRGSTSLRTDLWRPSTRCSTADDPMLFCSMLPASFFFTEHRHLGNRWSLCAKEICYRNPLLGAFFQSGKTLPIQVGSGPAGAGAGCSTGLWRCGDAPRRRGGGAQHSGMCNGFFAGWGVPFGC